MSTPVKSLAPRVDPEEEALAIKWNVPILISGQPAEAVAQVASRIHAAKFGSMDGFARTDAVEFPLDSVSLVAHCACLVALATDVTVFIANVERLAAAAQPILLEALAESNAARPHAGAVRLISGTTVSLWDHVQGGTFSESLFYRLNAIHLILDRD